MPRMATRSSRRPTRVLYRGLPLAAPAAQAGRGLTFSFALAIFAGAFLLFQIQPIMGKFVLPRFGGAGEVWMTCLLFFQLLLLGGYAYAHLLVMRLSRRGQVVLHLSLLGAALAAVPLAMRIGWKPSPAGDPTLAILGLLAATVGLPYVVLAATGPLMQGWFSLSAPGRSPYRLYAMSNLGSLLALLSYPVLVEPALTRRGQMYVWWAGLAVFVLLAALCARRLLGSDAAAPDETGGAASPWRESDEADPPLRAGARFYWLALPAAAVVELMAITTAITQDIAPVPLLWIIPLALYLASFIVCFEWPRGYVRWLYVILLCVAVGLVVQMKRLELWVPTPAKIAVYCLALLSCCMICHGEVYRLRPAPRRLTGYYLMIAAGGALGGLFVAVLAPRLFNSYVEFELGLAAVLVMLAHLALRTGVSVRLALDAVILLATVIGWESEIARPPRASSMMMTRARNFYGMLEVYQSYPEDPLRHTRLLSHGTTLHGLQMMGPTLRREATSYYTPTSGVGRSIAALQRRGPIVMGVVGLGTGTLATYCRQGDRIVFYEINPEVPRIARKYFTYLSDCRGSWQVELGDGRLLLEAQAPQQFDLLVVDAFSSDSIPLHLLTQEAMETYLRHLKDNGILAFHVSSGYLDLQPVLARLADRESLPGVSVIDVGRGRDFTRWILLSNDLDVLREVVAPGGGAMLTHKPGQALWTDDYVNILQVFKPRPWHWGMPKG